MIKSVTIINHIGESTVIDLNDSSKTGLAITNITGIGPMDADVHISEYGSMDGGQFSGARLPSRTISFYLNLLEHPTVEETRLSVYRIFPLKKTIQMIFDTDVRSYKISGIVKSNDPDIFSKEETIQITVNCPDPYFRLNGLVEPIFIYKVEPTFEFPFSNESLTEKLIEFGRTNDTSEIRITNPGMDDIGATFIVHIKGPVTGLSIINLTTSEILSVNDNVVNTVHPGGLTKGDLLNISTVIGSRYAILTRSGVNYNFINSLNRDSKWVQLLRGDNVISFYADSGIENVYMEVIPDFKYEGI